MFLYYKHRNEGLIQHPLLVSVPDVSHHRFYRNGGMRTWLGLVKYAEERVLARPINSTPNTLSFFLETLRSCLTRVPGSRSTQRINNTCILPPKTQNHLLISIHLYTCSSSLLPDGYIVHLPGLPYPSLPNLAVALLTSIA